MDYPDDCNRHLKLNNANHNFQEGKVYYNLKNEHDLLINTLQTIWQNYTDYIEDTDIKVCIYHKENINNSTLEIINSYLHPNYFIFYRIIG